MKLSLIFLMTLSLNSFASDFYYDTSVEDCSALDFRSSFKYKPRNQDKMSWCYAFTTADMIGYEYGTDKISAADIALNYNRQWIPKTMSAFKKFYYKLFKSKDWLARNREHVTGFIKISVKRALKKGLCLSSYSPDNYLIKVDTNRRYSKKITYRYAMDEILKTSRALEQGDLLLSELGFYYKTPQTTEEDFLDILENTPTKEILLELNNRSCTERIQLSDKKYKYYFKGKRFFSRINSQMDNNKLIAIDYHGKVRGNPTDYKKGFKGLHTSSLVGRRFNEDKNSCEYLVRDSYGPKSCKRYHPSIDCERGHFWLDERTLFDSLVSYSYFE